MTVRRKFASKRTTTRHRAKVARKVREHRRKAGDGPGGRGRSRRDPGIPAVLPHKDAFVARMHAEQERERENRRQAAIAANDLSGLVPADSIQADDQADSPSQDAAPRPFYDASKRAYYRELQAVVDAADVLLVVLDARDPAGCRVRHVEQAVAASGGRKRLVFVLNKVDLLPKAVVAAWLAYLRREYPTVAFKASTQKTDVSRASSKLERAFRPGARAHKDESLDAGSACVGAETLLQLLKNYARSRDIKTSVAVGVVGYPNVGKSSVVNSLKRARVCRTGSAAGVTTAAQEVVLDRHVRLIDCPGVVFAPADGDASVSLMLRNCLRVEAIADPSVPVAAIVSAAAPESLMALYSVPRFRDAAEFLLFVARRQGKLLRGGVPDVDAAARAVLRDWNAGRIPFHTLPPALPAEERGAATLVAEWAPEFDLASLASLEADEMMLVRESASPVAPIVIAGGESSLPSVYGQGTFASGSMSGVESSHPSADGSGNSTAPMAMGGVESSLHHTGSLVVGTIAPQSESDSDDSGYDARMSPAEAALNPRTNRDRTRMLKAARKAAAKAAARAERAMVDD